MHVALFASCGRMIMYGVAKITKVKSRLQRIKVDKYPAWSLNLLSLPHYLIHPNSVTIAKALLFTS